MAGIREGLFCLLELTKPRLAMLSTLTGVAGFLAGSTGGDWPLLVAVSLAVFLCACGALALNQAMECQSDAKMERTKGRPLPSGRMRVWQATLFGSLLCLIGLSLALVFLPLIATLLILLTICSYLFVYTPLKRVTLWCTHVGAFPGALPPLIGWSAATGQLGGLGLWMAGIVLLWQMPHFFAIGWLCREDYQKGGIRVLTVTHPDGKRLVFENLLYLILLFPVALGPVFVGSVHWGYGVWAVLLTGWYLAEGLRFSRTVRGGGGQNLLFLVSLVYLPLLLIGLLIGIESP